MTYRCKRTQAYKLTREYYGPTGAPTVQDDQYTPGRPGLEESPATWKHLSDFSGVRDDGTLWVWGSGRNELAKSLWREKGYAPDLLGETAPTQVGTDTDWVESFSGSDRENYGHYVLARKSDGSLWSLGSNDSGQLGIGLHCVDATGTSPYAYRFKISSSIESLSPAGVAVRCTKRPTIQVQTRVLHNLSESGQPFNPNSSELLTGEPGSGAVVRCDWKGAVEEISVTNGGSGYTSRPTVTVRSSTDSEEENAAGATASVTKMSLVDVASFTVTNGGTGYTQATIIEVLTGATGVGVVNSQGAIIGWSLTSPGSKTADILDKSSLEVVIDGDGSGATSEVVLSGGSVQEIEMDSNPECWESVPTVEITGGGGSGAAAVATAIKGSVFDKLVLVDGGSGYTQGSILQSPYTKVPRLYVVAIPHPSEQFLDGFRLYQGAPLDPNGTIVAEVVLSKSGIVSAGKRQDSLLKQSQLDAKEDGSLWGANHRTEGPGFVRPFSYTPSVQTLISINAIPQEIEMFMLGPGSQEVQLQRLEPDPEFEGYVPPTFSLNQTSLGHDHCPVLMLKYVDPPAEAPATVSENATYGRVDPCGNELERFVSPFLVSQPDRTSAASLELSGSVFGGTAEYEAVDGWLSIKSRTYDAVSDSQVEEYFGGPGWELYSTPPVPVSGVPRQTTPYRCKVVGAPPTWAGPSINQSTAFHFFSSSGPGGYAVAEVPSQYGNGYVGVGDIVIVRAGDDFREEPTPRVKTNFYTTPMRIDGEYTSVSCFGKTCLAVGSQGDLHWWGERSADSGLPPSHFTATPTPVGRGAVPEDASGPSPVESVESNRAYFAVPNYGNFVASFGGAQSPFSLHLKSTGGFTGAAADSRFSDDQYSPMVPLHGAPGIGYTSPPNLTFMACGEPVYSASTKLVGPTKFTKVSGAYARGDDGIWYDMSSGVGEGVFHDHAVSRAVTTETKFEIGTSPPFFVTTIDRTVTDEQQDKKYLVYASASNDEYTRGDTTFSVTDVSTLSVATNYEEPAVEYFSCTGGLMRPKTQTEVSTQEITTNSGQTVSPVVVAAVVSSTAPPSASIGEVEVVELPEVSPLRPAAITPVDSLMAAGWTCPAEGGPIRRHGDYGLAGRTLSSLSWPWEVSSVNGELARTQSGGLVKIGPPPLVARPLSTRVTDHGSEHDSPAISLVDSAEPEAEFDVQWEGKLIGVGVIDGGSGYRTPPSIAGISGATCTIAGPVSEVTVTSGGSGYRYPPDVVFSRPGIPAKATATIKDGAVETVSVSYGGVYRAAPTVSFVPVVGVESINVTDAGGGFTSQPSVLIGGGGGEGAAATCRVWGSVKKIKVLNGGENYTSSPQVVITNQGEPGFSQASATAQVNQSGQIVSVTVTTQGDNYTTEPLVQFVDSAGSGASAVAEMDYRIRDVTVSSHGHHYAIPPKVLFLGGGGGYAEAAAVLASHGEGAQATTVIDGSVISVSVPESARQQAMEFAPVVTCVRAEQKPESATDAKLKARIAGEVTGVTPANSAGRYSEFVSQMQEDRRKPSAVYLMGSGVDGSNFERWGTGYIVSPQLYPSAPARAAAETSLFPHGGPIVEVGKYGNDHRRFYHKPIAMPWGRVRLDTITCLQLCGAVPELQPGASKSETVTGRTASDGGGSAVGKTWPDVVSCVGSLHAISSPTFGSLPRRYSEIPTVVIEDDVAGTCSASIQSLLSNGSISGNVQISIASSSGSHSFRASPYLYGGKPLVWSTPATATTELRNGRVWKINVTNGAAGYTSPPRVYLVGGGGTGATAGEPEMNGTSVEKIPIASRGSRYTSPPTVVLIDSEVPADRDEKLLEFFGHYDHFSVSLKNWSVEFLKYVVPKQFSMNGFVRVSHPSSLNPMSQFYGYVFHPLYMDTGYVESVLVRDPGCDPYPAESNPQVTIQRTGEVKTMASATATPYNYSDVYGESRTAMPLSPERESYS